MLMQCTVAVSHCWIRNINHWRIWKPSVPTEQLVQHHQYWRQAEDDWPGHELSDHKQLLQPSSDRTWVHHSAYGASHSSNSTGGSLHLGRRWIVQFWLVDCSPRQWQHSPTDETTVEKKHRTSSCFNSTAHTVCTQPSSCFVVRCWTWSQHRSCGFLTAHFTPLDNSTLALL